MGPQHVTPRDAVRIHIEIGTEGGCSLLQVSWSCTKVTNCACLRGPGSKESVGMHWGTFELADEPFLEPPSLLKTEVEAAGLLATAFNVRPMGRVETVSP